MRNDKSKSILIPFINFIMHIIKWISINYILRNIFWKKESTVPIWYSEAYVLFWVILITLLYNFFSIYSSIYLILIILSIYRLIDILIGITLSIFIERKKFHDDFGFYIYYSDIGRLSILLLLNIYEIIINFSVFYFKCGNQFVKNICDRLSAFYFSIVTMTTLGYGEIRPNCRFSQIIIILHLSYFIIFVLFIAPRIFSGIRVREFHPPPTKKRYNPRQLRKQPHLTLSLYRSNKKARK